MTLRRRTAILVLIAITFLAVGSAALWQIRALSATESQSRAGAVAPDQAASTTAGASSVSTPTTPAEVLRAWDRRRARAYAEGDLGALGALYVDGSRAGRQDVRLLERYLQRGLTVEGMSTQVLKLRMLRGGADEDLLWLRVSDRVTGAAATGDGTRVRLPTASARARMIKLVRRNGRWLVSRVRDTGAE